MPWISNLIHLAGWTGLITATWKIAQRVFTFVEKLNNTEQTVIALATNHIPHLQAELEKSNKITEEGFDRAVNALNQLQLSLTVIAAKK